MQLLRPGNERRRRHSSLTEYKGMDLLEISLIVSSVLSFLACMSSLTPVREFGSVPGIVLDFLHHCLLRWISSMVSQAYNVVLPFFGLWGLWSMRPRGLGLFLALLAGKHTVGILAKPHHNPSCKPGIHLYKIYRSQLFLRVSSA